MTQPLPTPNTLFNEIVMLIVPHVPTESARSALVNGALFGSAVINQIDWSGSAHQFAIRLVTLLLSYGTDAQSGTHVLVLLLRYLDTLTGVQDAPQIARLCDAVEAGQLSSVQDNHYAPPVVQPPQEAESPPHVVTEQARRLEAATPRQTRRGIPTEVWVKVVLPASEGLKAELPAVVASGDVIERDSVRSSSFPIAFEQGSDGKLLPAEVCIAVSASGFDVAPVGFSQGQCGAGQVFLRIPPQLDAPTLIFELTPNAAQRVGRASIRVLLLKGNEPIATLSIATEIVEHIDENPNYWQMKMLAMTLAAQPPSMPSPLTNIYVGGNVSGENVNLGGTQTIYSPPLQPPAPKPQAPPADRAKSAASSDVSGWGADINKSIGDEDAPDLFGDDDEAFAAPEPVLAEEEEAEEVPLIDTDAATPMMPPNLPMPLPMPAPIQPSAPAREQKQPAEVPPASAYLPDRSAPMRKQGAPLNAIFTVLLWFILAVALLSGVYWLFSFF